MHTLNQRRQDGPCDQEAGEFDSRGDDTKLVDQAAVDDEDKSKDEVSTDVPHAGMGGQAE